MGSFINGLAKGFVRSAVNQVGRDAGRVVSNQIYGDAHSIPHRNVSSGGAGRVYRASTNAYINTGDGLGMAARAGIPLQDMEFWQFHPK